MILRRAHPPVGREGSLTQDSYIERELKPADARDSHNLLLDAGHHASSHVALNAVSTHPISSSFLFVMKVGPMLLGLI